MSLRTLEQIDCRWGSPRLEGLARGVLLLGCFAVGFLHVGLSQLGSVPLTSLRQLISLWVLVFGEPNSLAFLVTPITEMKTGNMADGITDTWITYLQHAVIELQSLMPSTIAIWLSVAAANVWEV